MRLVGPTLTLRLPVNADAPALFALGADAEVVRWFSWGPYTSLAEPEAWLAEQPARRDRGEALVLVVERAGALVGVTELTELSRRDRRAVVGTWLARAHWGTGVNAEAKALLSALAFTHLGLERLSAYADVRHARSQAALVKQGFVREGTLRAWHRHGPTPKDVAIFGLLRAEWAARPRVPARLEGALPPAWSPG